MTTTTDIRAFEDIMNRLRQVRKNIVKNFDYYEGQIAISAGTVSERMNADAANFDQIISRIEQKIAENRAAIDALASCANVLDLIIAELRAEVDAQIAAAPKNDAEAQQMIDGGKLRTKDDAPDMFDGDWKSEL